jgi:hypothetical protein
MNNKLTVKPLGRAVFGAPHACPLCGGELAPLFGAVIDDNGRRRTVLDPTQVQCRDCLTWFKVEE